MDITAIYTFGIKQFGHIPARKYLLELEQFLLELASRPELARDASLFAHSLKHYRFKAHVIFFTYTNLNEILVIRVLGKRMDFIQHL